MCFPYFIPFILPPDPHSLNFSCTGTNDSNGAMISNIAVLIQKSKKSGSVAKAHVLLWQQLQAQHSASTLQMVMMHPSGDEPSAGQGVKCIKHINPLIILPFLRFILPLSLLNTPVIGQYAHQILLVPLLLPSFMKGVLLKRGDDSFPCL